MIEGLTLAALVWGVQAVLATSGGRRVGKYLPAPFWIYFLPILLSTFGLIPSESPVYAFVGLRFLPLALILLLVGTPLKKAVTMGKPAALSLFFGSVGMFLGVILSFGLLQSFLPLEGWKGAGALLGSWTGGSANLLSVKEIVGLSDDGLTPLIITDTLFSYGWFALLILGAGYQKFFNQKNNATDFSDPLSGLEESTLKTHFSKMLVAAFLAWILMEIFLLLSGKLASLELLSKKAWVVLLATTGSLILAGTPAKKIEHWGASKAGTFALYLVLASIGAKTNLAGAQAAPIYFLFALITLLTHGSVLLLVGRLFKIPMALLATASQANVGGPASAPIVASVYRPGAAPFGVLMAIVASAYGTYLGWAGALFCRWMGGN